MKALAGALVLSLIAAAAAAQTAQTAQERMQRRFPQPVRVGDLVGLPVLDENDVTIGRITQVVTDQAGNVLLIVPYGSWTAWHRRPVAVPVEVVAMLGRQVAAIDMKRAAFDAAPDWPGRPAAVLGPEDIIRVALTRR